VYRKVLAAFASSGRAELALLVSLQVQCYEDTRLLKQFRDIVKMMYDLEIIGEDTIMHWYKKASHPKGRNVFLKVGGGLAGGGREGGCVLAATRHVPWKACCSAVLCCALLCSAVLCCAIQHTGWIDCKSRWPLRELSSSRTWC
jgi:hypothetical protein